MTLFCKAAHAAAVTVKAPRCNWMGSQAMHMASRWTSICILLQVAVPAVVLASLVNIPAARARLPPAGGSVPRDAAQRPQHSWLSEARALSDPYACPWPAVAAAVSAANGLLSVRLYNETLHGPAPSHSVHAPQQDDGPAIKWAINATHLCGGVVFFPQGKYIVNETIDIPTG